MDLENVWRFQNEFRWFSWIRQFKAVSLGCFFLYVFRWSTWSTKSHSFEWKVPMCSMNNFHNMKIANLFNSIQVGDILPIGSNSFCKWFWSGFWVPKHFLTGYYWHWIQQTGRSLRANCFQGLVALFDAIEQGNQTILPPWQWHAMATWIGAPVDLHGSNRGIRKKLKLVEGPNIPLMPSPEGGGWSRVPVPVASGRFLA